MLLQNKKEDLTLGFLCSHSGSNMLAIINNILTGKLDAEIGAVISNNSNSGAIQKAKALDISNYHISDKNYPQHTEETIINTFNKHNVNIVILAGYMKKVSANLINSFSGRVLNIHPALLPKYGGIGMYGMCVHKAVLAAKEEFSGATVHLVDANYDQGRILLQQQVPVLKEDTAETLAARVLETEHIIYTEVLKKIVAGSIII